MVTGLSLLFIKMAIQNIEFSQYSHSVIVISSFYAATAYLKSSKKHECIDTMAFCSEVRKIIISLLKADQQTHKTPQFKEQPFLEKLKKISTTPELLLQNYTRQFNLDTIEKVGMSLLDFFKVFDNWHPGLNQLKKFN